MFPASSPSLISKSQQLPLSPTSPSLTATHFTNVMFPRRLARVSVNHVPVPSPPTPPRRAPRVGDRVAIFWEDREQYFGATITRRVKKKSNIFDILYDDGDQCGGVDLDAFDWKYVYGEGSPCKARMKKLGNCGDLSTDVPDLTYIPRSVEIPSGRDVLLFEKSSTSGFSAEVGCAGVEPKMSSSNSAAATRRFDITQDSWKEETSHFTPSDPVCKCFTSGEQGQSAIQKTSIANERARNSSRASSATIRESKPRKVLVKGPWKKKLLHRYLSVNGVVLRSTRFLHVK